ncbi:MAG TPA: S-layer homology domain-containing protein [Bacillota bacterium]|nr:S-layer homology domain-containing protein [Bacillota bacterium]
MMKRYLPVVLSVLLVIALAVPAAAGPFADVPENHWAYEAVKQLAAYGLVIGFPDGEYKGNEPMTRYQMAMVIARLLVSLDAQIKAEVEAAKTTIPPEVPVPEKEVVEQPVIEKIIEKTIVEKLETEELDALKARVAALEDEVGGLDADTKAKIAELEAKIAKGDADNAAAIAALKAELAALDIPVGVTPEEVDAKVNEAIALIDALRAEFVTELDILNAKTNCLDGELQLAMERLDVLEQDFAALDDKVAGIDASLSDHLAGHEKVKITGSSTVKFEDVDIRSENPDVKAWKDPSEIFEDDEDDNHGSGKYAPKTDFKHQLALTLTAYPADGVTVKADLATVTNLFTGDLTGNLEVDSLSLEVTTPGVLERLYAGDLTLPDGTFTDYTFWGDMILDDDDDPIFKGVTAELGYGMFSGTLLFTRIQEASAAVAETPWIWREEYCPDDWVIVWPEGFDPDDETTWPEPIDEDTPFDPAVLDTWPEDFFWDVWDALEWVERPYEWIIPGTPAVAPQPAKYAFAGEAKAAILDNLNLGVAYVRVWDDYLSDVIDEEEERPYVDQVISLAGDYSFLEGWKVDGEYARHAHTEPADVTRYASAAKLNLSGTIGPATVKGEYVRVEKDFGPEFVHIWDDDEGLKRNVKTIGASVKVVPIENLTLTGGYKITGNAGEAGGVKIDWEDKKHAIAEVGAEYKLAWGDLTLTPSLNLKHTNYIIEGATPAKYGDDGAVLLTTAAVAAEFKPIEASFTHVDARVKGAEFEPYYKKDTLKLNADYDVTEAINIHGGYEWDKREYENPLGSDADNHDSEFNIGAKAGFAVYEGISLNAAYDYAVANDHLGDYKPYTKSILKGGVEAQVTPKSKIDGKAEYQRLDRFYDGVQYPYAPVTNIIGEVKYAYNITTNTDLNLGYKVIKSDVDDTPALSYLARIITGSLKVTF